MRHSIEPRDGIYVKGQGRIYVKGYGFLSFAKNIGTHATKVVKNLSNKYGQKLLDSAKTALKRAIQKTAEATGDLIGNKIADKITSALKKVIKELQNNKTEEHIERATPRKRYISPEERQ